MRERKNEDFERGKGGRAVSGIRDLQTYRAIRVVSTYFCGAKRWPENEGPSRRKGKTMRVDLWVPSEGHCRVPWDRNSVEGKTMWSSS